MTKPNIAVKIDIPTEQAGYYLSVDKHEKPNIGLIVNSWEGSDFHQGDKVLFTGWYDKIEIDGDEMFIIQEDDIKAIL